MIEIDPKLLTAHPANAHIYGTPDVSELRDSILENGILVPLVVTEDFRIISGTRRWLAAQRLGFETVTCELRSFDSVEDEVLALIEYNKYRVKNPQQIYNESREVKRILLNKAKERMLAGIKDPEVKSPQGTRAPQTREVIAEQYGMGQKKFRQIEEIFDKKETFPDIARKVATEEISVNKGHKILKKREARQRIAENPPEESDELTLFKHLNYAPRPWDVWAYKRDDIYGQEYPGSIPAGIVFNTLYFYTEPGDLVVDPMAGGGVVGAVCKATRRECQMFDIQPVKEGIDQHDLNDGFPVDDVDLVFLDPPYYKKMEQDYGEKSISALDREAYLGFFDKLASDIYGSGAKKVAFLMSDYTDDEDASKHIFIWEYVKRFERAGWVAIRHIQAPISSTAMHPDFVVKFRKSKKLGRLGRSLVIFGRND